MDNTPQVVGQSTQNKDYILSELDQALHQIRCRQPNQGLEKWERCFRVGRDMFSLTDALNLKINLARVLIECDFVKHAREYGRQVLDDIDEDRGKEDPRLSLKVQDILADYVWSIFSSEAESPTSSDEGDGFDEHDDLDPPYADWSTQGNPASSPTQLDPHSGSYGLAAPSQTDEFRMQMATEEVENRIMVDRPDGTHQENGPSLSEENIPDLAQNVAEESQISQASPTGWTTAEADSLPRDQTAVFLASNVAIKNSDSWLLKFRSAIEVLKSTSLVGTVRSGAQVKIAILDTGCNISDPYFLVQGIDQVDELRRNWHDCLEEFADPIDEDKNKHGTALTILLLLLVPEAAVHVIRVARGSSELESRKDAIRQAIQIAVERDVNIVSMSYGFEKDILIIQNAITEAETAKKGKILFFAAANNDGLNEPERFPARFESVISVRGTDHEGGIVTLYNPKNWDHKPGVQFCTLAKDVPCGFPPNNKKRGCSVATPILAAIAATVIDFVEREGHFDNSQRDDVRTRRGMLSVFSAMAAGQSPALQRLYVAPWQLFENNRRPLYLIGHALSTIPQQE